MPETPGDDSSPKTVREFVQAARRSFVEQMYEPPPSGASWRGPCPMTPREQHLAAFNNAITELVLVLSETVNERDRLALDLGRYRTLSRRKAFGIDLDPVCARCIALAAELHGGIAHVAIAGDGDLCSRCGAVVVQQRPGESEDAWRARVRCLCDQIPCICRAVHAGASRDGTTPKEE